MYDLFEDDYNEFFLSELTELWDHHQLSSSASEGRHAARVQDLHRFLTSAVRLMTSYESKFVQVLISSNHIRLGLPCADLFSSLPSGICSASLPLDPRRTCPAKANFCFLMLLRTCSSVSFIRCITSLLDTLSDHFILSSRR